MPSGTQGAGRGDRGLFALATSVAALCLLSLPRPLSAQAHKHGPPVAGGAAAAGAGQPTAVIPPANPIAAPGEEARIAVGQAMAGELEPGDRLMADSTFADLWSFDGLSGQTVTIDLRSDEFDTYLLLLGPDGRTLAEDDDSGGDLNSRLVYTLPARGPYQIVVTSAGHERKAGLYTLSVR